MIAYLLLAHGNPAHLQRLIARLRSDGTAFFIHVDQKANARAFAHLALDDVTLMPEPVAVHWGDYSQVEAILLLMKTALAAGPFTRFVLLSGVDYPLKPTAAINAFFAAQPDAEYINLVPMPCAAAGKPLARLTSYTLRPTLSALHRLTLRVLLKARIIPRQRDHARALGALTPYGGSTWWALTRGACDYLVDYVARNPGLVRFFKGTQYADETFLQTILGNSPFMANVRRNLTYTDWSGGGASPANMSAKHVDYFRANTQFGAGDIYGSGPMIFARKFGDSDAALLQAMDTHLSHAAYDRPIEPVNQ
ncbi:hypothetical protein RCH14_004279 [Massilia sp. MP_M2]|uniref:beta-1,6-N-acetylglucosaminyltransferase n=1 Tax=Massilia sp. MP_M2 TaxID=3071713 RepID=UPI00319D93A5